MRNDGQRPQGGAPRPGRTNGFIPSSFRALSSYLRIVSSGASTVARSAASAASAILERDSDASHDQVCWAGFDKIECEGDITRQVLLLGYRSGFQVWDVEEADNVCNLVSRHDGTVSFMQMLPKPVASKRSEDKFASSRPLLVICADGSFSGGGIDKDGLAPSFKGNIQSCHDSVNGGFVPTVVWFYSLGSDSYKHVLEFRSVIYSVRCSSRVVAVLQAAQIHCFDAATLEREYTILTNHIVTGCPASGGIGYGPLAVGPRWIAYSGSVVAVSNSGRVSPQDLTPSASNGSLVAHYAKESSKQLAAGIVTLGDKGYKKLSRYYSELIPESNKSLQTGSSRWKVNGIINGHLPDADNVGMVIVRDIVSKSVIAQFRAHKSPISSLCFDPSGTLLVTASDQGHNINVFRIMPRPNGNSSKADSGASCVHLYRLQRGFTNAVIQDISFSDDSCWIMISSSRGTSHLFAISPSGGSGTFQSSDACSIGKNSGSCAMTKPGSQMLVQQNLCAPGPPVTLSVVSRIRNGNNGWRSTVSGAATGRMNSLSGTIASSFHKCKSKDPYVDSSSLKAKYHLLVFSPSGCVIQYALRIPPALDSATVMSGLSAAYESSTESDSRLVIEAIQRWNICQKHNRRERDDHTDIYGENGNSDSSKVFPEEIEKGNSVYPEVRGSAKAKISAEEKHHMYISEFELQMHQAQIPLWAKPEITFQSMMMDGLKIDGDDNEGGEIEIESIPTCMIEARSRDLVPVTDYFPTPISPQARIPDADSNNHGQLLHQSSGPSENGLLCKNGSDYLDYMNNGGRTVAELQNGIVGSRWDGHQMLTDTTKGFVYNSNGLKSNAQPELVYKRENSMEAQLKYVNNNRAGLKMENQFEDEGDEFD